MGRNDLYQRLNSNFTLQFLCTSSLQYLLISSLFLEVQLSSNSIKYPLFITMWDLSPMQGPKFLLPHIYIYIYHIISYYILYNKKLSLEVVVAPSDCSILHNFFLDFYIFFFFFFFFKYIYIYIIFLSYNF